MALANFDDNLILSTFFVLNVLPLRCIAALTILQIENCISDFAPVL